MIFVGIPIRLGAMNAAFGVWLDRELQARGWSQSEAARRGEMSSQMVNALVNGQSNPGLDSCQGIARAFKMPLEDVFRLAGILPAQPKDRPVRERVRVVYEVNGDDLVLQLWRALSPEDQRIVRDLMERLAQVEPRIIGERPEE
jgi:transcriptional regulator with XRE-family HTH domain